MSAHPLVQPHTREWDYTFALRDGSEATVSGAQMPGGRITVRYLATGTEYVAADAGDYVYPSDVRLGAGNDFLYVKAKGLGAGIWKETRLFEYDLRRRRLTASYRVDDRALPRECPDRTLQIDR